MTGQRYTFPPEWSSAKTAQTERLTHFVENAVEKLSKAGGGQLMLRIPWEWYEDLKEVSLPGAGSLRWRINGHWRVDKHLEKMGVAVAIHGGYGALNPTDYCTLEAIGGERLWFWVPPETLTAEEAEIYCRVREDGAPADVAAELSQLI